MKEVVADDTRFLTDQDRKAIVSYLKAQKPIENEIKSVEDDDRSWYQRLWDWLVAFFSFT